MGTDTLDPGKTIAGRYVVEREIGRGGMGVVYRVEHVHTGEKLALKLLARSARFDIAAVTRFKREARASTQIKSEHVVRVTDADTAPDLDGTPFIVMELLDGLDVEKYLERCGALSPKQLVALFGHVGRALDAAHRQGIVHRDLKPENLFIHRRADGTRIAKVLDFGISKFAGPEASKSVATVTGTGAILGTPIYMSPEQALARNTEITAAADIWALGLVAVRLLTGEHYWGEPTMPELMVKLTSQPIVAPSERWPNHARMSPELDEWFLRSCDRDPSKRYASVAVQIEELASALGVPLPAVGAPLVFEELSPASKLAGNHLALDDTEQAKPETLSEAPPVEPRSGGTQASPKPSEEPARIEDAVARTPLSAPRPTRTWMAAGGFLAVVAGVSVLSRSEPAEPSLSVAPPASLASVAERPLTVAPPHSVEPAASPDASPASPGASATNARRLVPPATLPTQAAPKPQVPSAPPRASASASKPVRDVLEQH